MTQLCVDQGSQLCNVFTATAGVLPASSTAFTRIGVESIKSVYVAFNESGREARGPAIMGLHLKLLLDPLAHNFSLAAFVCIDFIIQRPHIFGRDRMRQFAEDLSKRG
jgi:hypothetical protein